MALGLWFRINIVIKTLRNPNGRSWKANSRNHQRVELSLNIRNETGSVIISVAGGKQSALEGEAVKIDGTKIENGAFTYCVLEYLKQTNETATVNGLKSYVEKKVEEITKGKQRPTSRQETM